MNDLIFITAFCPTEEQERVLEKCVDSVLQCGKDIALISHSHIPIHIQKKCQYYFYDHLNDTSNDYNLLGFQNYTFANKTMIESRFFQKYFYGFAIYRMFSMVSQIAINFGYKNIHHIEYDCEILDKSIIDRNGELLKEYDSVICTDNGNEDGFLFGSFKSFKVSSLPEHFKNYNRDFIENEMKAVDPKQLETLTKKLFINSGKVLFQPHPSDKEIKKGMNFYNRNLHYTLFYNPVDLTLNIFFKSFKNVEEEIVIIVNKESVITLNAKPNYWTIKPLGVFDEINHVRIDNSEKVIYEKTFDNEIRKIFKIDSYITNEENN
jgi:hypothetical protein